MPFKDRRSRYIGSEFCNHNSLISRAAQTLFKSRKPPRFDFLKSGHFWVWTFLAVRSWVSGSGGRAVPSRCGAQCKTKARGPSEQWFYDVIVFSQPCYDRGRAQICGTALTRELSTFANVREEFCWFWRERSLLTMKFIWRFYWILKRKVYLAKWIIYPNTMARGP